MKFSKIAGTLAGAALVAGTLIAAPATVAPVQLVSSASAVCLIAVPDYSAYRVKVNQFAGYKYFETYTLAYNYLHGPNSWTGTIWKKIYIDPSQTCDYVWQFKHSDYSTTS